MRRAARTDANQAEIVAALRAVGAVVQDLSRVGEGCPDLLVSHGGRMALLEVKDGRKPPSARQLTPAQVAWHRAWRAKVWVVSSVEEALSALGINSNSVV